MAWSIARLLKRNAASSAGYPLYSELRSNPTRRLPEDLTAEESSAAFSTRRDALQQRLLEPDSRPGDDATIFTELISQDPCVVVTFPLPDAGQCLPVFTTPFRAADYRQALVSHVTTSKQSVTSARKTRECTCFSANLGLRFATPG